MLFRSRLKVRGWKKIFHANGNQKKSGVAILISDKIDFKIKNVTRDKEGLSVKVTFEQRFGRIESMSDENIKG